MINCLRYLVRSAHEKQIVKLQHAYIMANTSYIYAKDISQEPGVPLYACCTHLLSTGCFSEKLSEFQELLSLEDKPVPDTYWKKIGDMLESLQMIITLNTVFNV